MSSDCAVSMIMGMRLSASHPPADRQAVFAGKIKIEDQQVIGAGAERSVHFLGVCGDLSLNIVRREIKRNELADFGVILDDQN